MRNRVELRYSGAFKRQVVEEVESGRFDSVSAASAHYGIKGKTTVVRWVRQMGKGHLLAKVVRVEQAGEADRVLALRREVERLQRALGQTQAERLLEAEFLTLACGQLGEEVEAFKKKSGGRPCTPRPAAAP